jgi:hypothetical protein
MNCYASANYVLVVDFKAHAKEVTRQVMAASKVEWSKEVGRYRYLESSKISKDKAAREILQAHPLEEGLAAVLQCVERLSRAVTSWFNSAFSSPRDWAGKARRRDPETRWFACVTYPALR